MSASHLRASSGIIRRQIRGFALSKISEGCVLIHTEGGGADDES
jgi:hypothetical protein